MPVAELAALCEAAIPALNAEGRPEASFRMPPLSAGVLLLPDIGELLPGLGVLDGQLGTKTFRHHFHGILRAALLIEPVVIPGVTTTRFRTRWQLGRADPRYATPEDCLEVARELLRMLQEMSGTSRGLRVLHALARYPMVPYEPAVTYRSNPVPIHRAENFQLIDLDILEPVTGFRERLLGPGAPRLTLMRAAYEKIQVKTYLTDRAQTGPHKTNREKRWEAHPESVQFATHYTCVKIERVLVNQLCFFDGFPPEILADLERENLLAGGRAGLDTPTRCPVTLLPMSFAGFEAAAADPQHGRSAFQVGHLDPLKLEGNRWTNGHRPDNISWVSEEGNRIQGSLSLNETRSMLRRIWTAYSKAGLL